jgi:hypothetical protein
MFRVLLDAMQILHTSYAEEHGVFALQESRPMLDLHHGNRAFRSAIYRRNTMYQKNVTANPIAHTAAWRAHKAFPLTATIKMLTNTPRWRPASRGADFYAKVLSQNPATVGDAITLGKTFGYKAGQVQSFLRFLYTWGDQVEIAGKRYQAVVEVKAPKQPKVA